VKDIAARFQSFVAVRLRPSHLRGVMWYSLAVVYRQLSTIDVA